MMFDGLKTRLRQVQERLGAGIEDSGKGDTVTEEAPPAQSPKESAAPGLLTKVKVLVADRELIIGEKDISEALEELEIVLLENDVALSVSDAIIAHVRADLVGKRRKVGVPVEGVVTASLRGALLHVLGNGFDLLGFIRGRERPVRLLFTGVNGTGKTTSIAKIAFYLKKHGFSAVIAAGDTYRAGAIEQIDIHAERVGIKVIRHQHGADPSAVLFDAVEYARAHSIDVVLADTAGRFHNKVNLMNQLTKMRRVMNPDLIIYVDEAVAGNDATVRSAEFDRTVGADAVVLTKADMDTRGGAAISIAHTIGKPVMFLGVGQGYDDIIPFEPVRVVAQLLGGE